MHGGSRATGRTAALLAAALVSTLLLPGEPAPPGLTILHADAAAAVPGEFLVAFDASVDGAAAAGHARRLTGAHGGDATAVFRSRPGFAVAATDNQARRIAADPAVAFVQRNLTGSLQDTQATPAALWNLDRIDQRALPVSGTFSHQPSGVPIYVLDDGVRTTHAEFEGRARAGFTAFGSSADCGGHGTRVAGIAAGRTYGAAKQSPVVSVKVADCNTVTSASVVQGLEYVRQNATAPAVVNLSVGFAGTDTFVDDAVKATVAAGFTVVIAAGNGGADSCTRSPARVAATVPGAIVVSATDRADARPADANTGACVSMFAPGVDVTSAGHTGDTAVAAAASGTSFAAPLVSGAAAAVLGTHPAFTPLQVKEALVAGATAGVVTNPGTAANRLLRVAAPQQRAAATVNSGLNTMFNSYGDQGGHWTGGDEAVSVPLPDGRTAWFFGDTMLGTVNPDGTRPPNQPMVHNTMVIQQGSTLVDTRIGGTAAEPKSLVGSADDGKPGDLGWWPSEGRVVGNEVQVFYTHVGDGGGGAFSYRTLGRAVARFSLPALTLTGLTELPLAQHQNISWGASMVDGQDGYTYIYGTESVGQTTFLKVARVPASGALTAPWQFWTGASDGAAQWSSDVAAAARVMSGVGTGFSLKHLGGRFVLATFDLSQPFSNRLLAFSAAKPTGPFVDQTLLYEAPEAGVNDAYAYNARIHPQATPSGSDFTVSYNVNTLGAVSSDARLYRPRFVNVKLPALADGAALPAAPRNPTATPLGDGLVRVSWTAPPGSGLTYQVYERDVSGGATTFTRTRTSSTTSVDLEMFRPGRYEFRVAARSSAGEGAASTSVTAGADVPAPATAPGNVAAQAKPDGTVGLSWTAVTGAGWIDYRVVQRDVTAGETTFTTARGAAVDGVTAVVGGLEPGHTYAFQVYAYNGTGDGPRSAEVRATAQIAPPPAPTNLVATNNPDGTVKLTWTHPDPALWSWVYSRNVTTGEAFAKSKYPITTGGEFTAGYLNPGDTYAFYVVTFNSRGESAPSNTVQAVSRVAPPDAPTDLVATQNDDGTIGLEWASSGPDVWYYVWTRDVTAGGAFTKSQYPITDGPSHVAGYLTTGHTYAFRVTAIGVNSESAPSNTVQTVSRIAPLPAPRGLTASGRNDGTIDLEWDSSGADVWYYVYTKDVTAGGSYTRSQYPISTGPSFNAGYLTVGHTYAFQVTAINGGGESAASNTAQAVSYVPPPAAPTNLRATAGNGQVNLAWNAAGSSTMYYVYTKDVDAGGSYVRSQYPITGTTFTAGYLTNGHTHSFYVTALGTGGVESGPSATVQATPRMPKPSAPTGLTATSLSDGKIRLNWNSSGSGVWYWVYSRDVTTGGSFRKQQYPVTSGTSFTAEFLTLKHTYEFYVAAFNDGGESPSGKAQAQSRIPLPPAPSLTGSQRPDGSIYLDWTNSGSGLWYWVYYRKGTSGAFKRMQYPVTDRTNQSTADWRDDGDTFQYYVRAINAMGEGPASNTVTVTSRLAAPAAPGIRLVPDPASNGVRIFWPAVANATQYRLDVRPCGTSRWSDWGPYTTGTSYTYQGQYCNEFRVTADNRGKQGATSAVRRGVGVGDDYPYPDVERYKLDPWGFVKRECTSFATWRVRRFFVPAFDAFWKIGPRHWYHAKYWETNARDSGVRVSTTPEVGAVLQSNSGTYGHVAFVVAVDNGTVWIEEYNGSNSRAYSLRTISGSYNYLHFQDY